VTPGQYGALTLNNLAPVMGATVVLTGSTFTSIDMINDENLTIRGGTVSGSGDSSGRCWSLDLSANITFNGNTAVGCTSAGFSLNRSTNVTLAYWSAKNMNCDAVDLVGIDTGTVSGGSESASAGVGACHPDAVQGWSYGTYELEHIVISGNTIVSGNFVRPDGVTKGQMGFDFWNNNGPNGTPMLVEDIKVLNNTFKGFGGSCVAMYYISGYDVENNICVDNKPEPWTSEYFVTAGFGTFSSNQLDGVTATPQPVP
jgi:hypothetical protein